MYNLKCLYLIALKRNLQPVKHFKRMTSSSSLLILIVVISCYYLIPLHYYYYYYYYYFIDIHFFIKLCVRYIVTAESKSLFNYGNRTEKIFWPTQPWTFRGAGNQKKPDWDF